ncbi:MAG: FecR domain-containing protein [Burkholderiales bacterium]|nr:FecR domain-containing protein [Burkholderiales bacterium]
MAASNKAPRPARLALACAALAFAAPLLAQPAPIGEVEYVRGAGALERPGEAPRVMGNGSAIAQGELLTTSSAGFAVVKLNDGTRMTMRPNSSMRIDEFVLAQPDRQDSLVMNLLRGGLRVVTGAITRRPGAGRLQTPTATVGIRGTDFDARICAEDCRGESRRPPPPVAQASVTTVLPAAARVAQLSGELTITGENGVRRAVAAGGPAFKGDTIETPAGANAVLVFRDDTRITVAPGTRIRIDDFTWDARAPADGGFAVNLLKGGIRALTGALARARPQAVRFTTSTATVGIRGTGVDMLCEGACAGEPGGGANDGFFIFTWRGEVGVTSARAPDRIVIVPVGAAARLAGGDLQPVLIQSIPDTMRDLPRPDGVPIDLNRLFGATRQDTPEDGLYVFVRDGHLAVESGGQTRDIARGEALFASLAGDRVIRLENVPAFIQGDSTPRPDRVDARGAQLLDLLSLGLRQRANLVCRP